MLADRTLKLVALDFKRIQRLTLRRPTCLPVILSALRREFPGQPIVAPRSSADRYWRVGDQVWLIMDNGREVNRCRLELLAGNSEAFLNMIKVTYYAND